jgi:hypothetical protein
MNIKKKIIESLQDGCTTLSNTAYNLNCEEELDSKIIIIEFITVVYTYLNDLSGDAELSVKNKYFFLNKLLIVIRKINQSKKYDFYTDLNDFLFLWNENAANERLYFKSQKILANVRG